VRLDSPPFAERASTCGPEHPEAARTAIRSCHLRDVFLRRSETFVYELLMAMNPCQTWVVCHGLANAAQFPFEHAHLVSAPTRVESALSELALVVTGRLLPLESRYKVALHGLKPDVIHAHFGPMGVLAWPIAGALDVGLVTTFYGYDMSLLARMATWRRAYRMLFQHGAIFLVEGSNMARHLAAMGCPEEKICIFRIGVNLAAIDRHGEPRTESGGRPRLLMAGRMVEKKGMSYGLSAFAQVAGKYPHATLRVVGDGPMRDALRTQAAQQRIDGRVEWLGGLSYPGYLRELHQASVFLAPSVVAADGDSEGGAPTTLLEAQAARVPVLSTTHADIPEVVLDGESGYLVPERDVDALAERLAWLLGHPGAWQSLGAAGRAHVEANHNVAVQARILEGIYARLVRLGF